MGREADEPVSLGRIGETEIFSGGGECVDKQHLKTHVPRLYTSCLSQADFFFFQTHFLRVAESQSADLPTLGVRHVGGWRAR